MKKQIFISLKFLFLMIILTGILYPIIITGIAGVFFKEKATGSLVKRNGLIIGSELIGQNFDSLIYFWPRPSAIKYNPLPSGGSNLGPLNPTLEKQLAERKIKFLEINNINPDKILPPEMITASASGLDPHISPLAAQLQVSRISRARGFDKDKEIQLINLINEMTEKRQFSILGEPRINVFLLNLKLDDLK